MSVHSRIVTTQCLIIAGNVDDRQYLARLLGRYGFELAIVEEAEQAVSICRTRIPDIVVMSQDLDGIDTFEFLQELQRVPCGRAPKILVFSDSTDAGEIGRAIWGGASECFMKPFDAAIIDLKLRQVGAV